MKLSFDSNDILNWAVFSSDYNPIHFDKRSAKKLGSDDIIVHGMLVILEISRHLSEHVSTMSGPWIRLQCRLRDPVVKSRPIYINSSGNNELLKFSATTPERSHISGSVCSLQAPDVSGLHSETYTMIDSSVLRTRYFINRFGGVVSNWISIGSMVFADFIDKKMNLILERLRSEGHILENLKNISQPNEHVLVQTSYHIEFDHRLVESNLKLYQQIENPISYHIDQVQISQLADCSAGTVDIIIRVNDEPMMIMNLGLLLKLPRKGML